MHGGMQWVTAAADVGAFEEAVTVAVVAEPTEAASGSVSRRLVRVDRHARVDGLRNGFDRGARGDTPFRGVGKTVSAGL